MALRFADVGLEIIIVSPRATSNKRKEEVGEGVFIAPNCLFFDNKRMISGEDWFIIVIKL